MISVNQQFIKATNMKRIYTKIEASPSISRARLAEQTFLSKPTVSTLVDELIDRHFIKDTVSLESANVGRRPNALSVCQGSHFVVVFSWCKQTIEAHLVDIAGTCVFNKTLDISNNDYISPSVSCLYNDILKHCHTEQILGICVVVSAMIDEEHGEIYSTTMNMPVMQLNEMQDKLKKAFPEHPVALLNDTACYSYAEKVYGCVHEKNFVFINFSQGIGATLFANGNMLGNASGSFTQFGHYSIKPDGPTCSCGNKGCLEVMLSEPALKQRIHSLGACPALDYLAYVTFYDLGKAATFHDAAAINLIHQMAEEFSIALSNLICLFNPSLIILGGKIPNLGEIFLDELRCALKKTGFRRMIDKTAIRYSKLQSDAFLNGAMRYFFDIHYSFINKNSDGFFIG